MRNELRPRTSGLHLVLEVRRMHDLRQRPRIWNVQLPPNLRAHRPEPNWLPRHRRHEVLPRLRVMRLILATSHALLTPPHFPCNAYSAQVYWRGSASALEIKLNSEHVRHKLILPRIISDLAGFVVRQVTAVRGLDANEVRLHTADVWNPPAIQRMLASVRLRTQFAARKISNA